MHDLDGRTFAVSGASGNLGRAVVEALAARGARLVLLDRSPAGGTGGDERVRHLGGLDLGDPAAVAAALDGAGVERLDGLVAATGGFALGGTALAEGWTVFEAMIEANLKATVAAVQAVVPRLPPEGGRIVTVGAGAGVKGPAGIAAYAASKGALLRFTESLAAELKGQGATVNAVLPGIIDTPQNRSAMPGADRTGWVPPADIAQVIAFLLSDAARSVTGALIPVSGRG